MNFSIQDNNESGEIKNTNSDKDITPNKSITEKEEICSEENGTEEHVEMKMETKNIQHESNYRIEKSGITCNQVRDKSKSECEELIFHDQKEFHTMYQDIVDLMKSVTNQEQLRGWKAKIVPQLKIVLEPLEGVTMRKIAELPRITPELVRLQEELNKKFDMNLHQIKNEREQISQTEHQKSSEKMENFTVPEDKSVHLQKHVSLQNYRTYMELESFRRTYKKRFSGLLMDVTLEQFKSDCKKAVNTPLKKLFSDPSNLAEIHENLHDLLSGKPVKTGTTIINAANHPEGVAFCTDLLAEKIVLFGEFLQSPSSPVPFYFAALVVTLWNDFTEFGKLVLAHFYKFCPSLLPYYIPRGINQPIEDFNKCQGFRYSDGVIEKQESFMKRLTGMMRLYSAIFLSNGRRGRNANPHGFAAAWRWLASILNLDPRYDVTATVLGVFFETAGYEMDRVYGRAFRKLVNFVKDTYVPLILKVDSGENAGRLRFILEEYSKKERFDEPDGFLTKYFW